MQPVSSVIGIPPTNAEKWKKIKEAEGTNAGGWYVDEFGSEWYVKIQSDPEIARNEVLASKIYEVCGITVPTLKLITLQGRIGIASKIILGLKKDKEALIKRKVEGVYQGFAVDAWLANWDVIGDDYSNILLDPSDRAVRIDVGGALRFRARGMPKGEAFGEKVSELKTFLNGQNPCSKAVFAKISDEEIKASAKRIAFMPDIKINNLLNQFGPLDQVKREELSAILSKRRIDLLSQLGFSKAELEKEEVKDRRYVGRKENKRRMNSEILYCLLTYGDGASCDGVIGNWNSGPQAVRGITSWLVKRALSVDRYPWHTDHALTSVPQDKKEIERWLVKFQDQNLLDEVCAELREIYKHTQKVFSDGGIKHYKLTRSFQDNKGEGYATRVVNLAAAARYLGLTSLSIPFDVITSWGAGPYSNFPVFIEMYIPVEDILWGGNTVASYDRDATRDAVENGEWIVVNRALDSMFVVPVDSVSHSGIRPESMINFTNKEQAQDYLKNHSRCFVSESSFHTHKPSYGTLSVSVQARVSRAMNLLLQAWHALRRKNP